MKTDNCPENFKETPLEFIQLLVDITFDGDCMDAQGLVFDINDMCKRYLEQCSDESAS